MQPRLTTAAAVLLFSITGLTACGSSEPEVSATSSVASSVATTTSSSGTASSSASDEASKPSSATSSTTSSSSSSPASASSDESSAAPSDSSTDGGVLTGPAPSGAVIKAGAGANLPDTVANWTKPSGSSGPGVIYNSADETVIVSFLAGSSFEGVVTSITNDRTDVGTGACGSASSPTNLTCYLKTADGVINVSADAGDTPLPDLILFADALTTALGLA